MPIGRSYSLNDLKSALNTRMAEFEMLNKTLIEAIEKGSSEVTINAIKGTINDAEENIKVLRDWIEKKMNENEKVDYSFCDDAEKPNTAKSVKLASLRYDEIKKSIEKMNEEMPMTRLSKKSEDIRNSQIGELNHKTKNLYDSIKKDDKKNAANLGDYKPYDTPYNKLNFEDLYCLKFLNSETKEKYLNETITAANRFLVRFSNPFKINEWLVKSVDFNSVYNKELLITMQDHFVTREDGSKYPIISELRSRISPDDVFNISIDYLDRTGYTLYTERYHGCKIKDIIKSSLSYEAEGYNTIQLTVTFSHITYGTSH